MNYARNILIKYLFFLKNPCENTDVLSHILHDRSYHSFIRTIDCIRRGFVDLLEKMGD
jgi:hypothetical protein